MTAVEPRRAIVLWRGALAIGLMAFAVLWGVYEVLQPINTDQGVFLWAGDVIRHGGVMYRDAWDTRGPMPFYFTAALEIVFDHARWGFRFADLLIQLLGAWGVTLVVRSAGGGRTSAVLAAVLYLLWYASLESGSSAQPDGWVGVMLLFAVLSLVRSERVTFGGMFTCGFLLGLAILNKPTYGLFVLLPVLYAARTGDPLPRRASQIALSALGCLLPLAIAVLYFSYHGALATAFDVNVRYTVMVLGGLSDPLTARMADSARQIAQLPMAFALPFAVAGALAAWRTNKRVAAVLTWWAIASLLNAIIQHRPWQYEWLPTFAPFAVLAGVGVGTLPTFASARVRPTRAGAAIAIAAAVLMFAVGALRPVHRVSRWAAHVVMRTSSDMYQQSEFGEWGYQPSSVYGVAQYIRSRTSPSDYALFFGAYAGGTFYAERPNPTRFAVVRGLVEGAGKGFRQRYRTEFMVGVRQHRPKYVVTLDSTTCKGTRKMSDWRCSEAFPEFRAWVIANYAVENRRGPFEIWRDTAAVATANLQQATHGGAR